MTTSGRTLLRAGEFDLRTLREQSDGPRRRKRWMLIVAIALSLAWALIFVGLDAHGLATASLPSIRFLTLLVVLGFASLFVATAALGLPRTRHGADIVRVNDSGLEIIFPSGRPISIGWEEPRISFELYDFSSAPRSSVLVDSPYFLRTKGTESVLSGEVYQQIFARAQQHDLIVKSTRGSRWIYPAAVAPVVHYVRSGSPSALSTELEPRTKQLSG